MENLFITAIGTDSGKTLVSSILVEALGADYWKPIQAGEPTDTNGVKALVSNKKVQFHPERYVLEMPASPHAAAKAEGIHIKLSDFELPETNKRLIIEGAGGMLVPFNDDDYVINLAQKFNLAIILVSNLYLGNINHTLLSIEYLKQQKIKVKGIIFNGESNPESERIILSKCDWPCLFRIPVLKEVNREEIKAFTKSIRWEEIF
ncbi:MAG: dethiobiotin synthase [Bacteroidota bacterium]